MGTAAPARQGQRQQAPTNAVARVDFNHQLAQLSTELDRRQALIAESAASLIDPVKMKGVVLSTFTRTPSLWECDPISIARSVVEAAQAGLEPTGSLGGAYLVPFFNSKTGRKEAQLIIGYTGLVKLARRSGEVAKVEARIVRQADAFAFGYGLHPYLDHVPALDVPTDAANPMTHAYAVAHFRSGETQFDVMSAAEILAIKARSKAKDSGPWVTDEAEMWKKTVLRRLSKLMPLTIEAQRLLDGEDAIETEPRNVTAPVRVQPAAPSRIAARIVGGETTNAPAATGAAAGAPSDAPAAQPVTNASAASSAPAPTSSGPGADDAVIEGELVEASDVVGEGVTAGEIRQWLREHGVEQAAAREVCMRMFRLDSFDALTDEQRGLLLVELDSGARS